MIETKNLEAARAYADAGKMVAAGWHTFRNFMVDADTTPEQLADLRSAFVGGAHHIYNAMLLVMNDDPADQAAKEQRFERLNNELNQLVAQILAGDATDAMPEAEGLPEASPEEASEEAEAEGATAVLSTALQAVEILLPDRGVVLVVTTPGVDDPDGVRRYDGFTTATNGNAEAARRLLLAAAESMTAYEAHAAPTRH